MSWVNDLASVLGIPSGVATLALGQEGRLPHSKVSAYAEQFGKATPPSLLASFGSPNRPIL